jgi:hypothetical protein
MNAFFPLRITRMHLRRAFPVLRPVVVITPYPDPGHARTPAQFQGRQCVVAASLERAPSGARKLGSPAGLRLLKTSVAAHGHLGTGGGKRGPDYEATAERTGLSS